MIGLADTLIAEANADNPPEVKRGPGRPRKRTQNEDDADAEEAEEEAEDDLKVSRRTWFARPDLFLKVWNAVNEHGSYRMV